MKLEEKDRPDKDILNKFQKSMLTVRGRESMQQLELENVRAHFEKEGIDYVPLKGWIIKNLYPKPYYSPYYKKSISFINLQRFSAYVSAPKAFGCRLS